MNVGQMTNDVKCERKKSKMESRASADGRSDGFTIKIPSHRLVFSSWSQSNDCYYILSEVHTGRGEAPIQQGAYTSWPMRRLCAEPPDGHKRFKVSCKPS